MAFNWYIVQAVSGHEKKVADEIMSEAGRKGMTSRFEKIVIPTEEVVEVKKGKKVNTERKIFPGYVLVRMDMSEEAWHLVRGVKRVSGFLGSSGKPQPVSEREVQHIFKQIEEGLSKPKNALNYEVGETVKILDGPFESFVGVVEEVDVEKERLKVSVSIFGRTTPVELDFVQVAKV